MERQIRGIIQTLLELAIIIHGFSGSQSIEVLAQKLNQLVTEYQNTNENGKLLKGSLPIDIVKYVELTRNPDVYTREFVELMHKQNQYVNGKFQVMRVRRSQQRLIKEIL